MGPKVPLSQTIDDHTYQRAIGSSYQPAVTSKIVKVSLSSPLSSAIASTQTFSFTFEEDNSNNWSDITALMCHCITERHSYAVWVEKIPPCGFLTFFLKRSGIFTQFFTHLLYVSINARLQIFIQLSPILTKLCHTKQDHPSNFLHFPRT